MAIARAGMLLWVVSIACPHPDRFDEIAHLSDQCILRDIRVQVRMQIHVVPLSYPPVETILILRRDTEFMRQLFWISARSKDYETLSQREDYGRSRCESLDGLIERG